MEATQNPAPTDQFLILTPRLILVPTPIAVSLAAYRKLYAELFADANFCEMGFGNNFPPRIWNDDESREMIETRDIKRSWEKYALGNFAVGLREQPDESNIGILKGRSFEEVTGPDMSHLQNIKWVGYAGIRDAKTTSIAARGAVDPTLPPWQEMVEIMYGTSPECWGRGITKEAAEAIIKWGIDERGVRRLIAETEAANLRSGRVLEKLGFSRSGTNYWNQPGTIEWELVVR